MNKPLLLSLFIAALIMFAFFYALSKAYYFKKHQVKYHFWQMFPYELNYPRVFKDNFFGNILFIFALGFIIAFYAVFYSSDSLPKTMTSITSEVGTILMSMLLLILLMMPLNYLRTHMVVSIFATTISAAFPILNLLFAYQILRNNQSVGESTVLPIISMVISAILAIIMLVLIFNPKATYKIYMEKKVDANGQEVYERPKTIFLALSEWWAIFTYVLAPISLLILIIA